MDSLPPKEKNLSVIIHLHVVPTL